MRQSNRIVRNTCAAALAFLIATAALAETSFSVSGRYTAQRRPRVTVLDFEDTNAEARNERYGSSVQAMLVTFLKRKSQFVVVERQKLGDVLAEWQRNQKGMTNLVPEDPTARELLEKLDAIIIGNVTLLNMTVETKTAQKDGPEGQKPNTQQGQKIEIDAKLLSRVDGRIIAAAQRSGPVGCLRSIVERLGITLEQEFLRPYYGKLTVNLTDPENVRVYLTPILLDTALDEEKPPVERGSTVVVKSETDLVEPWITDPTTYTIENLLSGWYSMRLERPGYEGLGTENSRWEAREFFGQTEIYERESGQTLHRVKPEFSRFVVRVDPLTTEGVDGDSLGFVFRKKGGSFAPRVKRQYLDTDYTHAPQRVILIGNKGLDLNIYDKPHEYADDEKCDLFDEKEPKLNDYGRTYIASTQTFDPATFDIFKGGELIIENYQGEIIPTGSYRMILWEPNYQKQPTEVTVRDRDTGKVTRSSLIRTTASLSLEATGAREPHKAILEGKDTRQRIELLLDFDDRIFREGLPVDVYTATTSIPGLSGWARGMELSSKNVAPPIYDPESQEDPPLKDVVQEAEEIVPPVLRIKTRMVMGGRLNTMSGPPSLVLGDFYVDRKLLRVLDALVDRAKEEEEERGGWQDTLAQVGRTALSIVPVAIAKPQTDLTPQIPAAAATPASEAAPAANGNDAQASSPEAPPAIPQPEPLPRDPEELRKLFARHLEDLDFLVLDDVDMKLLRQSPETAQIIEGYVEAGGALFAFVSDEGDYEDIVGAPLEIETKGKPISHFEIAAGEVAGIDLRLQKKKVQVKSKRVLPQVRKASLGGWWRVIAFTKGRKDPRILERGTREQGGYVLLWCDQPESFRGRRGGTVPDIEAIREAVEKHAIEWARRLMDRRYGVAAGQRRAEKTPR